VSRGTQGGGAEAAAAGAVVGSQGTATKSGQPADERWSNTDPLFKRMPAVQAVAVDPPGSLGVLFKLPKTKSRCSSASRLPVRCQSYGDADQAPRGRRTVLPLVRTRAGARWSPAVLVGAVQASDTSSSRYDGHTTPDGSAHGHVHSRVISQVALPFAAQA